METPEIPDMLLSRVSAALLAYWSRMDPATDGPTADAALLVYCLHSQGLEVRLKDPLLAAQETTGDWKVDE